MEIKELIRFVKQYRKLIDRASYVSIDCYGSALPPPTPCAPVGHWATGTMETRPTPSWMC